MSLDRIVPLTLLLSVAAIIAVRTGMGKENQVLAGTLMLRSGAGPEYEFCPDAKVCRPEGVAYAVVGNDQLSREAGMDMKDFQKLMAGRPVAWAVRLRANVSRIGSYGYGRYRRIITVSNVLNISDMHCGSR